MPNEKISINTQRARKIWKDKLGLRYGGDAKGAAYSLADFGDKVIGKDADRLAILGWVANPTPDWNYRLYNTMAKILFLADSGELLLVTKAFGAGERYKTTVGSIAERWEAYGDGKTFRKCNRLPPDSEIKARKTFDKSDNGAQLIVWVLNEIDKLEADDDWL